jgi:TolB-like protein
LPDKPSIAVLPIVNMSEDKDFEYFSNGLTEEIITAPSGLPKFFIIARNSVFLFVQVGFDIDWRLVVSIVYSIYGINL